MGDPLMNQIVTTDPDRVEGHIGGPLGWQEAMRRAYRDGRLLCQDLGLESLWDSHFQESTPDFPLFVPREWAARIRPCDPADPLLLQVLTTPQEMNLVEGFSADPVGDLNSQSSPGLLQKYHGRSLMITTGACGIHCRYCFRRHFPYQEAPKSPAAWEPALDQIASDSTISEVLLSGGDPLTLVDKSLTILVRKLEEIPHLKRLRIHTRMPVVIPQRVTVELLELLRSTRLGVWIVLHINHPNEIDRATETALKSLRQSGATLLNQAVLLRGINDSVEVLQRLCERLVDQQILPYYLHQLDRVAGAAHFEVPVATGQALMAELRQRLPGYAVPRYVQEIAGQPCKTPIEDTSGINLSALG